MALKFRINSQIRSPEVRVISADGSNIGVISTAEALAMAQAQHLDLIEISPTATPPIAKIADYGKFQYEQNKKLKDVKSRSKTTEVKTVQVKIGTGEHDLDLKAKRTSEWLAEGHRVKIDLFLPGRSKYLNEKFLKERLERMLKLLAIEFNVTDDIKKSPKGLSIIIEKASTKKAAAKAPVEGKPEETPTN